MSKEIEIAVDTPPANGSMPDVDLLLALIDQIEANVPGFIPYDINDARRVGNLARFAKDMIPKMIATVSSLPSVAGMNTFDVVEGKISLAYDTAIQPVIQRLSALLNGVQFTTDSRLARSTEQVLATYAWMKKKAKSPSGVELRPYRDDMALTMKKVLNRRSKPASKPAALEEAAEPVDDDDDRSEDSRTAPDDDVKN
ncbi:MAG TPA: hypothetical protein VNN25_04925 [Thermoanaerobaculia bacterium]|nr:hypothetical protein [Thermoanaerobaculia bacterium]